MWQRLHAWVGARSFDREGVDVVIRILVVPGDHRPTRDEIAGADVVLKLKPVSARVGLMFAPGECEVRRWPRTWADGEHPRV